MKYVRMIVAFAGFLLLIFPLETLAGEISGTVKVRGLRSPENVLVYLEKGPESPVETSKTRFVMDQRNLTFVPHVLPVLVGCRVQFPNHDKVNHNVFSLSRAKKFNLGSYKPGESGEVVFDKPGVVELRCDVHAEMSAYILVLRNPYWALTDQEGRFRIPDRNYLEEHGMNGITNLPPGKYFLKTWHEKLRGQKVAVAVPEKGDVSIQFELSRGAPGVLYKR
jgi:plastocyanin